MNNLLSYGWILTQPLWVIYLKIIKKCIIERKVRLSYLSRLEGRNRLGNSSKFIESTLGYASYFGEQCYFYNTQIGKYSCIGPRVKTVIGRHPTSEFVSVHPAFYSLKNTCKLSYVKRNKFREFDCCEGTDRAVIIGNDVWIGSDVLIMEGVRIGDGAIVGAGSIVLHDVLPYSIVAGTPARHIRNRFSPEIIAELLEDKWWLKDDEWIKKHAELFSDVRLLLGKMKCEK